MANCHRCLIPTPPGGQCFAKCKSSFGRFIVYTLLLASVIVSCARLSLKALKCVSLLFDQLINLFLLQLIVGVVLFSMILASRYISSLFFVSNAIHRVCGQSSNCASKLMASSSSPASVTDYSVSYVTIDSEDNARKLAE